MEEFTPWTCPARSRLGRHSAKPHWVHAIALTTNGLLASASQETVVRVWHPATGALVRNLQGHDGWVTALAALPDGLLASGSDDASIRLWHPSSQKEVRVFDGHLRSIDSSRRSARRTPSFRHPTIEQYGYGIPSTGKS